MESIAGVHYCTLAFRGNDGWTDSSGLRPKVSQKGGSLCHLLSENYDGGGREHHLIAKSTFDFLGSRGFDFDRKDVNVFDEKEEPGLLLEKS